MHIIKRIVFITLTLAACSGLVVLLVAAIGKRNHERCRDYVITIKGAQKNRFISDADVKKLLVAGTVGGIKNAPISAFNLRKLEQVLKENAWVQNANLYFDNQDVLHISVLEKEPVARIFTTSGRSFYIDNEGKHMPLSDILSARVPVFTNFPDRKVLNVKDSALLSDVTKTALFILNDPFWMAQTEQIDITEDANFEMVPTIGNHIVKLGNGQDIEKKFHRLLVFYQQVLSKTGFDKYNSVDVQFAGQVTGSKIRTSKVDSILLRKNIEKLLNEAKQMQMDTLATMPPVSQYVPDEQPTEASAQKPVASAPGARKNDNTVPVKINLSAKPKTINLKKQEKKEPKAVMPKVNA